MNVDEQKKQKKQRKSEKEEYSPILLASKDLPRSKNIISLQFSMEAFILAIPSYFLFDFCINSSNFDLYSTIGNIFDEFFFNVI